MSVKINSVALAGGSGSLGSAVLTQLLAASFSVTVLTRAESKSTFPSNVKVSVVDYDSIDSLKSALVGHDALVSTLTTGAVSTQFKLLEAAFATPGLKWIIPSEFGSNTHNTLTRALPVFADKVKIQEFLVEQAKTHPQVGYTLVQNCLFFDWGLAHGFLGDLRAKKMEVYDGGERPFSTTRLATIGAAVAGVLRRAGPEMDGRVVRVHDTVLTQNKIIDIVDKVTGTKGGWQITNASTAELEKNAYVELGKGKDGNVMVAMFSFLKRAIWGDGYGGEFEKVDNEVLGLQTMSDVEIEDLIAQYTK